DPMAKPEFSFAHRRITEEVDPNRADAGKELPGWAAYVVEHFTKSIMKELGYRESDVQMDFLFKLVVDFALASLSGRIQRDFLRARHRRNERSTEPQEPRKQGVAFFGWAEDNRAQF